MYEKPKTPLTVSGVLDGGFALFRAALGRSFVLVFVAMLLVMLLDRFIAKTAIGAASPTYAAGLGGLIMLVVELTIYGAILAQINGVACGERIGFAAALKLGLRRGFLLFLTGLLTGLAVLAGTLLLIVPGVYLAGALLLGGIAVIVERKGPIASLGRSRELVRGNWWRLAAVTGIIFVISIVVYSLLSIIVTLLIAVFQGTAGTTTATLLAYVGMSAALGVLIVFDYSMLMALYYDLRVRKEGTDLAERIAIVEA